MSSENIGMSKAPAAEDVPVNMALQYSEAVPDGRDPNVVIEYANQNEADSEVAVDQDDEDSNAIIDVENIDMPTAPAAEDVPISMALQNNEAAPDGRDPADIIEVVNEKVTDFEVAEDQDEDSDDVINVVDDETEMASAAQDAPVSMALLYNEAVSDVRDANVVIEYANENVTDSEAAADQDEHSDDVINVVDDETEDSNAITNVDDDETDFETAFGCDDGCEDNNEQFDDGEESAERFVPRSVPVVNTESVPPLRYVAQQRCPYYNVGYCKFRASCKYFHSPMDCLDSSCFGQGGACMNRHRVNCEMAQKGKCKFGPRCEFFHNGQTGFARTPLPKKSRQPRRKAKREDRKRGGSDSESNASGDTESNRSYDSRSNSNRNGSTSRDEEDQREKWKNVARKMQQDVENRINSLTREQGDLTGFAQINREKVDKVKSDLNILAKETNEGINGLKKQLDKTAKGFRALENEFLSFKRDCKISRRNQEDKLKELSVAAVQDSTHVSDDEAEGDASIHESIMTTGLA